jgi:hypothetical protein
MPTDRTLTTATGIANLLAAIAWLMVYGAAGLMCFARFANAIGSDPRAVIFAPLCSIFALLWAMLAVHGLVRPAALRTGRWYMTLIAIALGAASWTGWLGDAVWYGAVATALSVAAVITNIRRSPPPPSRSAPA